MGPFPQRHAWVWAVLPAGVARVCVRRDPALGEALQAAGFELAEQAGADDPTLFALGSRSRASDTVDAVLKAAGDGAVAVVIDRAPRRDGRTGAVRSAVARLTSVLVALPTAIERRLLRRRLARPGMRVGSVSMSDRGRSAYQLGGRLWRRGLAPVGSVAWTIPDGCETFVEAAVAEGSEAVGRPLAIREMTIVESGKILVELEGGEAERWFLRIAGGSSAAYISSSLHAIGTITASDVPSVLRERLVQPLADGRIGPTRYSLERKVAGRHPSKLTPALWEECDEFLVELHRLGSDQGPGGFHEVTRRLDSDLELLGRVLGGTESSAIEAFAGRLAARLRGLPLGWEHGDFWAHNIITVDGRLRAVLDWDTALAGSLPLLDLYDLISLPAGRRRQLHIGARLERVLLPLVRRGADERIRNYCDATGTPAVPDVLESVAAAYWVSRAARAVREVPFRAELDYWVDENVRSPLRALGRL